MLNSNSAPLYKFSFRVTFTGLRATFQPVLFAVVLFLLVCFSAQEADSLPYDFSNKPLNRILTCQKPGLCLLKTKQRARSPLFQVGPWTLRGLWGLTEKQLGRPKLNPTGNKDVSILPVSSPFQKLVGNTYGRQQSLAQRPLPWTRQYQKEIPSAN